MQAPCCRVCSGVMGKPASLTGRGEVPGFPRAQNPGRVIEEQEESWENFVPANHQDHSLGR